MNVIIIKTGDGDAIRKMVTTEDEIDSPTSTELAEAFFTALSGIGYYLPSTPERMADNAFNQESYKEKEETK